VALSQAVFRLATGLTTSYLHWVQKLTSPAGTSASSTSRPSLTPLVRLPQKGSTHTSPASGPAPAPTPAGHPQAAFSDDEEEDQDAEPTAAAAAAEETEIQNQGSQQEGVAAAEPPDSASGKHLYLLAQSCGR